MCWGLCCTLGLGADIDFSTVVSISTISSFILESGRKILAPGKDGKVIFFCVCVKEFVLFVSVSFTEFWTELMLRTFF